MQMIDLQRIFRYEWAEVLGYVTTGRQGFQDFFLDIHYLVYDVHPFLVSQFAQALNVPLWYDERVAGHEPGIAQDDDAMAGRSQYLVAIVIDDPAEAAIHGRSHLYR